MISIIKRLADKLKPFIAYKDYNEPCYKNIHKIYAINEEVIGFTTELRRLLPNAINIIKQKTNLKYRKELLNSLITSDIICRRIETRTSKIKSFLK